MGLLEANCAGRVVLRRQRSWLHWRAYFRVGVSEGRTHTSRWMRPARSTGALSSAVSGQDLTSLTLRCGASPTGFPQLGLVSVWLD